MLLKISLILVLSLIIYPKNFLNAAEGDVYECEFKKIIKSSFVHTSEQQWEGKLVFFWDDEEIKFTSASPWIENNKFSIVSVDEFGFVSNSYGKSTIVSLNNNFLTITKNTGITTSILNSICKIL